MTQTASRHSARTGRGFTLVEVMIAVSLALIVSLGIHWVFKKSADTISVGGALSEGMRGQKALQSALNADFVGYTNDNTTGIIPAVDTTVGGLPFLVITGNQTMAFRNPLDERNNKKDATKKTAWRTDSIAFFSRGAFKRMTGQCLSGNDTLTCDLVSPEAYIWWGHGRIPDANGNFYDPGVNPAANYYASDWVLCRTAILLTARSTAAKNPLLDSRGVYQVFAAESGLNDMSPFTSTSQIIEPMTGASLGTLRLAYYQSGAPARAYYDVAGINIPANQTGGPLSVYYNKAKIAVTAPGMPWWMSVAGMPGAPVRYDCAPVFVRPPNAGKMSMQAPYFLGGCPNVIVEFAGDFTSQFTDQTAANYGAVSGGAPDGTIDFIVKNIQFPYKDPNSGAWTSATQKVREIRWYGFKRDPQGDGTYPVNTVASFRGAPEAFERVNSPTQYLCAWGPNELAPSVGPALKPSLVRITVQWMDRGGHLVDGMTREYIFKVR